MRRAELILSIFRPKGKLGNRFTLNPNVVIRPLSARCLADNFEKNMQDEITIVLSQTAEIGPLSVSVNFD